MKLLKVALVLTSISFNLANAGVDAKVNCTAKNDSNLNEAPREVKANNAIRTVFGAPAAPSRPTKKSNGTADAIREG